MKKNTIWGSALCICLALGSCSVDNTGSVKKSDLVGKWNYETFRATRNGNEYVPEESFGGNAAGCSKDFIQLNDDNTAVSGDYHAGGTCALESTLGTWSLTGQSLTITLSGHPHYYQVDVTETSLQTKETISMLGVTEREYYTFSKQN